MILTTFRFFIVTLAACTLALLGASQAMAAVATPPSVVKSIDEKDPEQDGIVLPYIIAAESLGLAYGVAGGYYKSFDGKQVNFYGAVMASTNSSYALALALTNVPVMSTDRLFLDVMGSRGWYTAQRGYLRGNPDFPEERAGAHDSDRDNFLEGKGWSNWLDVNLRYVLPIGSGKDNPYNVYTLNHGMLVSGGTGGETWNPLQSGVTILALNSFARRASLKLTDESEEEYLSVGSELALTYDNRDFPMNAITGSVLKLAISRDFGWPDTYNTWTFVEGEFTENISLGSSDIFQQRVIVFNFWTANTPSWKDEPGRVANRPIPADGASLGGYFRMKGYPKNRFHDKAVIFYAAELKLTPHWNPIKDIPYIEYFQVDWWQAALFVEAGRVADDWNLTGLHEEMKVDVGVGFRMMAMRTVVRLDVAFSDEGFSIWAMVGHPF